MRRFFVIVSVALTTIASLAAVEAYQGAKRALAVIDQESKGEKSSVEQLNNDIAQFERSPPAAPEAAARAFISLVDRVLALSDGEKIEAMNVGEQIGLESVLRALPPPASWPIIDKAWKTRAQAKGATLRDESLGLLGRLLVGDRQTVQKKFVDLAKRAAAARGGYGSDHLIETFGRAFQERGDIADRIERLATASRSPFAEPQFLPDLIPLFGIERTRAVLDRLLLTPGLEVGFPEGSETRALAQEMLASRVDQLATSQWALTQGAPSVLYEAMEKKFLPASAAIGPTGTGEARGDHLSGFRLRDAQSAYIIALLKEGKSRQAESAMTRFAKTQSGEVRNLMTLAKKADVVPALSRALEAVFAREFVASLSTTRRAAALRAGEGATTKKALEKALPKSKGTERFLMGAELARLHLELDEVDVGVALIRALLKEGASSDPILDEARAELALTLAKVGVATARPSLVDDAVRLSAPICRSTSTRRFHCAQLAKVVVNFHVERGEGAKAERLLLADLEGLTGDADLRRSMATPIVVELVALYARVGRAADVFTLLTGHKGWHAAELTDLLDAPGHEELATHVASALAASGRRDDARAVLKRFLMTSRDQDHVDPAYALLASIDGDALIPWLDERFAHDAFDERPLIWKAQLLGERGDSVEAEKTARAAIAIDPSDGDQKRGDRLRAYTVLAEVLRRQGRIEEARPIDNAVAAIRLAEDADRLLDAGLTQRALALYEKASGQFADAYCIHARAAVELEAVGRTDEATKHYERAFELMPSNFGRVETHCFGCEGVFDSALARSSAERILKQAVIERPDDPRAHYMLGYLFRTNARFVEAAEHFAEAARLDPDYLNAHIRLLEVAENAAVSVEAREAAVLACVRLDPRGAHAGCGQHGIRDLGKLYRAFAAAYRHEEAPAVVFRLSASATELERVMGGRKWRAPRGYYGAYETAGQAVARQPSVQAITQLVGLTASSMGW